MEIEELNEAMKTVRRLHEELIEALEALPEEVQEPDGSQG